MFRLRSDDLGNPETVESAPATVRVEMVPGTPSVCPALPDLPEGHRRIWTGTVTVGERTVAGVPFGYGYTANGVGALTDPKHFDLGADRYTVQHADVDLSIGALNLALDPVPTPRQARELRLHVCGETYAFADAVISDSSLFSTKSYSWPHAGLDWSAAATRTVLLSKTNTPATGAPEISGTGRVGETLTAAPGTTADADGLSEASYSYRWIRVDGATEMAIAGATSDRYTLTVADQDKRVKAEVSFTDDLGFEETRASEALAVRAAMAPAVCTAPALPADETEVWTGDVTVGTVRFGGLPIAHGYAEPVSLLPGAGALSDADFETGLGGDYTVRAGWVSTGGSLVLGLDSALTVLETNRLVLHVCGETYPLSEAAYSPGTNRYTWSGAGLDWSRAATRTLRLRRAIDVTPPGFAGFLPGIVAFTGVDVGLYFTEQLDETGLPPASAFTVTADRSPVTVTGFEVDSTLTTILLSVSPPIREDQAVTVTYTDPTPEDDANAIQDAAGNDMASATVELQHNQSAVTERSGRPAISGAARVGETLTAAPGTIGDPDGLTLAAYSYQWIRLDENGERDISGATSETYTLAAADEGNRVRVRASFTDDLGNAETRTSEATATIETADNAPRIAIEPDRPKATGKIDWIRYTLTRPAPAMRRPDRRGAWRFARHSRRARPRRRRHRRPGPGRARGGRHRAHCPRPALAWP